MSLKPATTRNAKFQGSKIRVKGGLWLDSQKTSLSFSQQLHLYDPQGRSGSIQFIASRDIVGTFSLAGHYPAENAQELSVIKSGTILTDTELILDNNVSYKGDVVFESISTTTVSEGSNIPYTAKCRFTGVINTETTDSESIVSGDSGTASFGKSAATFSEQATIGYQDDHQDKFTFPFIITGVDESTQDLWDTVALAISTLTNTTKNTRGPSPNAPFVQSGTGRWAGRGVVVGTFIYGRGPRDCSPNAPSISIGFTTRGTILDDVINSGDSGDSGNFCESSGIGVTVRRRYKNRVPLKVYRVPGVWETDPSTNANFDNMLGRINDAPFVINGDSKETKSVRFDGANTQAHRSPAGTYWSGHLVFTEMVGGWKDNTLTCIQMVQVPLEGTQTVPGWALDANTIWRYQYPSASFSTIASLIPDCGY